MLIECLVVRKGITPIVIGKTVYQFMPIPKFDTNGKRVQITTSFCDVNSEEHLKYMLSKPNSFKEYEPGDGSPLKPEPSPMMGYAIEKYLEAGYIIADKVRKSFVGIDGKWKKERDKIQPFLSMGDALDWLKNETEGNKEGATAAQG